MPLKVLMIGWELPPYNSGGLGVACLGLSKALVNKGARLTFVLPKKNNYNYNFMDLVFADVDSDSELLKNSYTSIHGNLITSEYFDEFPPDYINCALKYASKMGKILRKCDVDIIHSHDWMTYPAGIMAKKLINKPLITHVHATEIDRTGGHYPNPFVYQIEKKGFELADRVISVSEFTKNILINNYSVNRAKIDVVHNGVDEVSKKKFPPALRALKDLGYKIVLFLGRITLQKGPEYFIRSAKRVLDINPKVVFLVVGSGDMQNAMMGEAASLGILDKVLFTGFLRDEEKDRIYQTADLYVVPSVSEPFGITPLEAIANHTPVLISKQSGATEVLNHVLKADFWDTEEMANKILAVLRYPSLGYDLRNESSKELVNLNWDKAAEKCMRVYQNLI